VRRASVRSLEHRSRYFQSGPVGQCEYTNAARGGGWHHLGSYTNGLRGNPAGTKPPSPPSRWHFVFAFRPHHHIANRSAECHLKTAGASWSAFAIASCPSSAAAPEWPQMPRKVMLSLPLQPLPPNPSIEGMPKRLRLLCTPHVKR
jgi:hypothetical protein